MRTAGGYLGAWVAIAILVTLVSFAFTLLGTMTSAVLAGMMMGAFKGGKWFSVLVSLVFPAVVFGMTRTARAELTPHQAFLLGTLCFGAYWITYLVSALLFFCEQKDRKSPRPPVRALQPDTSAPGRQGAATNLTAAAEPLAAAMPAEASSLAQLQGNWVCETAGDGEPLCKKVIQIHDANLELKAIDVHGRIILLARGEVTLQSPRPS